MANATFRKNSKTGNWDVFGPANTVVAGDYCSVSRADGTTRRIYVESVCRAFPVNGVPYVFGVIGKAAPKAAKPAPVAPTPAPEPTRLTLDWGEKTIVDPCDEDPSGMDF